MTQSIQNDLVPAHGGLAELVDQIVPLKHRSSFIAEAEGLPAIRVSSADLATVHRLADGALSPLT
ncbi:MAG TPA: sulfate adenylyltransferase, partial [Myxococcota bacterium]|nr:sulfate adenylyltransferase [Myxococcota bacterium]